MTAEVNRLTDKDQQASETVNAGSLVPGRILEVVDAHHSRLGDLTATVETAGAYELGLAPGDNLSLTYGPEADAAAPGLKWFLLVGPANGAPRTADLGRPELGERNPLPTQFVLRQNQPNPFFGITTIRFELPVESRVQMEVFDAQGRLVRTLAEREFPAGFHALEWDQRSDAGQALGAGVYLFRVRAGSFRDQKKMVLLPR